MPSFSRGLLWDKLLSSSHSTSHFLCLSSSIHLRASLLSLLIQCWKMSSQILLGRILADGLMHKWWEEEQTHRLWVCACTTVWLSACMCAFVFVECVHCMCDVCLCVWLCHISATSHAGVSASQARIEDTPCYFIIYQSMLYEGSWCNVPPRGFYFWNNTLWHVHVNKCVIYYYLIQSLCFCCQLLKHANDSTHEAFIFTIFNSLEAWRICPGNNPPVQRKCCILYFYSYLLWIKQIVLVMIAADAERQKRHWQKLIFHLKTAQWKRWPYAHMATVLLNQMPKHKYNTNI